jgi:CBS domain containing-hemolysin-like protein
VLAALFRRGEVDQSLRAHLEEVIDEHEDTAQGTAQGDLQQTEREMLRNLLHFSEMDAADVCIPRGEIIALPNTASWAEVVAAFATHGHSRMPVYRETLDEVIGMVLIKDVFPYLASGNAPARLADADAPAAVRALPAPGDGRAGRYAAGPGASGRGAG